MPMGLKNSAATFQRLMNHVLAEFIECFVRVYLDDILIYSETLRLHVEHVKKVIVRLMRTSQN